MNTLGKMACRNQVSTLLAKQVKSVSRFLSQGLKVALQVFGRKFYENTEKASLYSQSFNFHSLNPSSQKPSDNRRN